MTTYCKRAIFLISLFFLPSCATLPHDFSKTDLLVYTAASDPTIIRRHLPVFVIENHHEKHNLIGTPRARITEQSKAEIFIDPEIPSIYAEKRGFSTAKDSYINLIYRIHFQEIPFSLLPFALDSGKNVGIFVVVTLNREGLPILYTTLHTCGCFLAFTPTTYMPLDAFPDDWNKERQTVYGESLPGLLDYKDLSLDQAITIIEIRNDSHRVKEILLATVDYLQDYKTVKAIVQPLASLDNLPMDGMGSTSFYETSGTRKGYVKGSVKPWEMLLMGWWALDWRVGQDKRLGRDLGDGPVFYTSLKPWARSDSDMRCFPEFLKYWGWKL
jgi:hypothetical protein